MMWPVNVRTSFQKSGVRLGLVANSARGELKRENAFFLSPRSGLRIWSRETGSAVPYRVRPIILYTQAESGAY